MKAKKRRRAKGKRVALWLRKKGFNYEISQIGTLYNWVLIGGLCSLGFRFWFPHLRLKKDEGPIKIWITIQRAGRRKP